ncbi:MAG TPA: hypothetical protein VGV35_09525 [Bryobacteraceae bacterium]|nr:hypothetical protein [Bryobacteraceae bacterium]
MYDTSGRIASEPITTALNGIPAADIKSELDLILRSRAFIQSHRIRRFLEFIVEESLLGQPHRLKEYVIGLEVFDRREVFDPRVDSIVRVEARRLRNKLEEYYGGEGREDSVRILLRKGSYVPIFEYRSASTASALAPQKRSIEIAPLSIVNTVPDAAQFAGEIQRRLSHVLIKEGCFQVIAPPQAIPEPEGMAPSEPDSGAGQANVHETNGHGSGNGNSPHPSRADYIVEGSVDFNSDTFHLIVQLFQSADRSFVWSEAADGQLTELWRVEQLAQALLRELVTPANEAVVARRYAVKKESRDFYLQGRYHWKIATPDSIRNSVACFTKAVECDENYAAAWAALAEALLVSSMFGFLSPNETGGRMKEAALKATSLNAMLPEAHLALGALLSILDWDWTAGQQELEKSIQLDNHDPIGHIAYGIQLACRGMVDPALIEVERALELDPAALFPNFVLGWLYGAGRRFDEAISQHLLVSQLAPDYGLPHLGLGLAYAGKGMFPDAIAHFTNASQIKCRSLLLGHLGFCYAMAGRREEALREIGVLNERAESKYVSPVSFAAIYSGLGDKERALSYLDRAVEVRDASLPVHMLNPEFDNLRDTPEFQAIRQKIGLQP